MTTFLWIKARTLNWKLSPFPAESFVYESTLKCGKRKLLLAGVIDLVA